MTKKQMMALKPGDIVVEKDTGDQFRFVRLVNVSDIKMVDGRACFVNPRQELCVELIPDFKYARKRVTSGGYFYFSHKRMAVKEAVK